MAREAKGNGQGQGEDRNMSKASIDAAVQAAFALCATCSHERGEHEPGDGPCPKEWETRDEKGKVRATHRCGCKEFWPIRNEREDVLAVVEYAVGFKGGLTLVLNRRVTTELWEALQADRGIELRVRARVAGKGFKPKRVKGITIGLVATRKLDVETLVLVDRDGEVFDV